MTLPILTTKLFVPPRPANLIPRRRLIDALNAGLNHKLTLICAPAGFGKTTLAAAWRHALEGGELNGVDSSPPCFAWLSLDESDNDPAHFLTYVIAALQRDHDGLGETAVSLLQSPQPPDFKHVVAYLINETAALPHQIVLVLDDYHLIDNPAIHDSIAYLLDNLPPQLHLAITTRIDPPLPLARLRARRQMTEIRADDLRFTTEEAAAFLQQMWHIDVSPRHVAALEARTEGWIAGLQLAALSMQRIEDARDIASFVDAFTGSHRYVLDYLLDEVLHQQPADVQDFLLRSAILQRLSAPLCNAVLETRNSQAMLERLEAANLFVVSLDERREWYRYHHLFADLLRHRLNQSQPELLPGLHRRAGEWYAAAGLVDEAVTHWLAAGEPERAAALVAEVRWQIHGRGEIATLQRWLDLLPPALVDGSGVLAPARAWMLLYEGRMADAEAHLARVQPLLAAADAPGAWRGEMAVLQAQIALNHGDFPQALVHCRQARAQIPADQLIARSNMEILSGHTYRALGQLQEATQAYRAAGEIGAQTGDRYTVLSALTCRAALHEIQGQLSQAEASCREALAVAQDRRGRPLPSAAVPLIGLGRLNRERNRLDEAERYLQQALQLTQQARLGSIALDAAFALALVHMARGDWEQAHSALSQSKQFVQWAQVPLADLKVAAVQARLWLAQGNVAAAAGWTADFLATYGEKHAGEPGGWYDVEYGVVVRVWLAQEQFADARALLHKLLPAASETGRLGREIEFLGLLALAQQGSGAPEEAAQTLSRALTLAQPAGYVRIFADEGRPMGELLARVALVDTAVAPYVQQILAAIDPAPVMMEEEEEEGENGREAGADLGQWLAEPLSDREMEVLALVAEGLTNREIGARLVISPATVKKHVENIHGKLYVRRRTHAVARARELGLL